MHACVRVEQEGLEKMFSISIIVCANYGYVIWLIARLCKYEYIHLWVDNRKCKVLALDDE